MGERLYVSSLKGLELFLLFWGLTNPYLSINPFNEARYCSSQQATQTKMGPWVAVATGSKGAPVFLDGRLAAAIGAYRDPCWRG